MKLFSIRSLLAVLVLALTSIRASPARADTQTAQRPLRVNVQSAASNLKSKAIEEAVARELDRPIETAVPESSELRIHVDGQGKARLDFVSTRGSTVTRSIDLPYEPDRAIEMIALLAGNLVRDEASELVRALDVEARTAETEAREGKESSASVPPPAVTADLESAPATKPSKSLLPKAEPASALVSNAALVGTSPLNLSLLHPISLYRDSERRAFHFELGLAYGRVGAIDGVALEVGVIDIRRYSNGFVGSGLAVLSRGPSKGIVVSSLMTYARGPIRGATLTGGVVYREGAVVGVQLAAGLSLATDVQGFIGAGGVSVARSFDGAAVAAGASIATGTSEGALLAGGVTVAGAITGAQASAGLNLAKRVDGVQATGGINIATSVSGVQAAGGLNIAEEVEGLSIAPLNVSRRVRGLQLGIVNIAEEVDGAALGLVSIAKNGRVTPQVFVTPNAPLNLGVKFVVGFAYSELAFGYLPSDRHGVPQIGAGAHLALAPRLWLEIGGRYSTEVDLARTADNYDDELHYGARVGFQAVKAVDLFVGGGIRHGLTGDTLSDVGPDFIAGVAFF